MDRVSLIYKVLLGEANPAEKQELEEWVKQNEANLEEFNDIKLLWENSPLLEESGQDDFGFEKIRQRIQQGVRTKRRIRYIIYTCILIIVTVIFIVLIKQTWLSNSDGVQFKSTGINDVIKMLEHRYDIKIEVNNSELLKCQLTATFYNVYDKQMALKSIEHSLNVEFITQSKNNYRLNGNGCSSL